MGMYTQLVMGASIKPNLYPEIKPILDFMLEGEDEPEKLPDHPFFKCDRWSILFQCDSHYFDMKTTSKVTTYPYCNTIHLTIVSNLKNYDNEITKFLDWIKPYLDNWTGEFLGFLRYEENNEPILIYNTPETT